MPPGPSGRRRRKRRGGGDEKKKGAERLHAGGHPEL
jgi:hypothetical protein